MSDTSSSSYFRDPSTLEPPTKFEPSTRAHVTDEEGYPIHRSPLDSATRPSYIIPAGPSDGVWGMIRRVAGWKTEGYLSLWKGSYNSPCVITSADLFRRRSTDCYNFGRLGLRSSASNPHIPLLLPNAPGCYPTAILPRDTCPSCSFAYRCRAYPLALRSPPHKADMPARQRSFDLLTHLALPIHSSPTPNRSRRRAVRYLYPSSTSHSISTG